MEIPVYYYSDIELTQQLVPILSSPAGSCLTFANWKNAGINKVAYRIADLLMKPGLATLTSLTTIRSYYNWQGHIILNAILPSANQQDFYSFHSIYDGKLISIDIATLFALITRLQPNIVILPIGSANYYKKFWQFLPPYIVPYWHISEDLPETTLALNRYCVIDSQQSLFLLLEQINASCHKSYYMIGEFAPLEINHFAIYGKKCLLIESDKPAVDGLSGIVYSKDIESSLINIKDQSMINKHQPIDRHCSCQTCSQELTCAYLHHLLQYTPLLAQRYLVQHNIFFMNECLTSPNDALSPAEFVQT